MTFVDALRTARAILTEGSVIERLRRDPATPLDPHVLNAALLYDDQGRCRLRAIYQEYLDIGRAHHLPMLVFTPTWRANPERLQAAGLADRDVNADATQFMTGLRASCGPYADQVYVGGLLGVRGEAYQPAAALSSSDALAFHQPQVDALTAAGVDFLMAATLPAPSEALGLARAMAASGCAYLLSFVIRPAATCLDGTPLVDAIRQIDAAASPPPTAYLVNCVHPSAFLAAMETARSQDPVGGARVIGLQGNTSRLSPEELDNRGELDGDPPESFADALLAVHRQLGTRVLGGCCGTDARHIGSLADRLAVG